jgi:hypothetical protein
MKQSTSQKDHLTQHSFAMRLLCAELMLILVSWGISDPVWIYDNEPRNREIVSRISRTIDQGGKGSHLAIWHKRKGH